MINDEHWQDLKVKLTEKFSNIEWEKNDEQDPPLHQEVGYFSINNKEYRLIWSKRPMAIDKKTHFSNRAGAEIKVDYKYSEDEFVYSLKLESEQFDGSWQEAEITDILKHVV